MDTHEQPTRAELLRLLKERGEMTVKQLSAALGITPMGVRQHLDTLLREGRVTYRWHRHGPGRPCQLFRLTPSGDELFPRHYAHLALGLLQAAQARDFLPQLLAGRRQQLLARYRDHLAQAGSMSTPPVRAASPAGPGAFEPENDGLVRPAEPLPAEPLGELLERFAALRSAEGYYAEVESAGDGSYRFRQRNCAIRQVAEGFPALCDSEAELIAELVGAKVVPVRCVARGAAVCEFLVRPRDDQSTSTA